MQLLLYTRPNCPLCDRLVDLLEPLLPTGCTVVPRNILDDPHWHELYRERIPVLTWQGTVLVEGRPSADDVRQAVEYVHTTARASQAVSEP